MKLDFMACGACDAKFTILTVEIRTEVLGTFLNCEACGWSTEIPLDETEQLVNIYKAQALANLSAALRPLKNIERWLSSINDHQRSIASSADRVAHDRF